MGTTPKQTPAPAPVSIRCVRCSTPVAADRIDVTRHPLGDGPLGLAAYCPRCWDMIGGTGGYVRGTR